MAWVVFLRGLNVGGHRTLRPTRLAARLRHLGAVNIGAAGTFVIRQPVTRARLHAEFARLLPFAADILICRGQDVRRLLSRDFFAGRVLRSGTVRFASILPRRLRSPPKLPVVLPARGRWLLRILAHRGRFLVGMYRRDLKVIGCLGTLDRVFGAPVTTRNWNTLTAVAAALAPAPRGVARTPRGSRRSVAQPRPGLATRTRPSSG